MRRLGLFFAAVLMVSAVLAGCQSGNREKQAKYVFYFIGDGMGINQVLGTEMYLAELEGRIGTKPLLFSEFPVRNYATTYSSLNGVTCSAAAGTALATGNKTRNGTIGMDKEREEPFYSVAYMAKQSGKKVGVVTSVGMNHATPAAFYAHQPLRNMYYEIALDAAREKFDLYAGGSILYPRSKKDSTAGNAYKVLRDSGYMIFQGYAEFREKYAATERIVWLKDTVNAADATLGYAIDRKKEELSLAQITEGAVDFLMRDNKGFFLMVEGGMIDYACHDNDARTAFDETMDFEQAVRVAYDFYLKHPDETLIVITADHETGGLALGTGPYELNLKILKNQQRSLPALTEEIKVLRKRLENKVAWEDVRKLLEENLGFWKEVSLKPEDEAALKSSYQATFGGTPVEMEKSLYSHNEPIANLAVKILNRMARLSWASGGHSAAVVPVYAIGVGASRFSGPLDNTDIPKRVAAVAGYKSEKVKF